MMRSIPYSVLCATLLIHGFISCSSPNAKDLSQEGIIPKPVNIQATNNSFLLTEKTMMVVADSSEEVKRIADYFVQTIEPATGFAIEVVFETSISSGNIHLILTNNMTNLGEEGYLLTITHDCVTLEANKPVGLFRGIQTLRQLLPPEIERNTPQDCSWRIATGTIEDYPDYAYRGFMLDVARNFYTVQEVKKFIDYMAFYKMNVFHIHLTDDQGWRIEIKKWPKLTEIGGATEVGGRAGGFYTQEQFKDIIAYAAERYIEVIPEVDMPGHTNAALASYPELNCDNKAPDIYFGVDVGFSSLCTHKEITYQFIHDVIAEVAALSPSSYMHVGGDESLSTDSVEYIYFLSRTQEIVAAQGKELMGWNEIAEIDLNPNSIVQFWHNVAKGQKTTLRAVEQGVQIVMSPADRVFLDMKYDSTTMLGKDWAGMIDVDKSYNWALETCLPGIEKKHILGIECALWTETISDMRESEYMLFPRLLAYAEIGWTPSISRSWEDFRWRLACHGVRFKEWGLNFYRSSIIDWQTTD